MQNYAKAVRWALIAIGLVVAAYGAYVLYHYGVDYAAQKIRGEVTQGVSQGVSKGVSQGFGETINPISWPKRIIAPGE